MLGVVVVQVGLAVAVAGGLSLLKPLSSVGVSTRRRGALTLAAGAVLVAFGMLLPAVETRVTVRRTHLDEFSPAYQFSESHQIRIDAPREQIYRAVNEVTADEILFFRTLTWIRRFGRSGPESILDAPGGRPLLRVATGTSFLALAEDPGIEIVVGTVVLAPKEARATPPPTPEEYRALDRPGYAKATMNFRLEDAGSQRLVLTTETRVHATDAPTRRKFAAYWRVIYPGSALIRRMWLRAIKLRAEAADRRSSRQ